MTETPFSSQTLQKSRQIDSRVLLVGDYKMFMKALKKGLEEEGFSVDLADHDRDGAGKILKEEYDVIVLDLFRPGTGDLSLVRHCRQSGLKTQILVLTGLSEIDQTSRGLETQVDDFLTKPFPLDEFLSRVKALVCRI